MEPVSEHLITQRRKLVYNRHFWAILLIMAILTTFYNANHIDTASWFPWLKDVSTTEVIHDLHRSLFLIPLLYAGYVFRLKGAIICWLAFLAAVMPRALYFSPNPNSLLRTITFALVALLASVLIALEQKRRQGERESRAKLETVHHSYVTQVLQAQESERQRIAQELHDGVQQHLIVIANHSQALINGGHGELSLEARAQAVEIKDMAIQSVDDVRRISHDLRPAILDQMGLVSALRWLTEQLSAESGITTNVIVNGDKRRLNPEAELIIFRIIQEALNNTMRHSQATRATITMNFAPESIKIAVWDNGRGFLQPEISELSSQGKLGLNGMRDRAKLLGANLNIQSKPGEGTTITLEANV